MTRAHKKAQTNLGTSADHRLRILSYNIHKGFSLDNRFVLGAIKDAIHASGADIVFLQEVIGENEKHRKKLDDWPTKPQLEFLADSVWEHQAYGMNAVYTDGHHGNAILSSRPILAWENIDISNNRFERRGLLHATVSPLTEGAPPMHLVCVHLDLFERGRKQQLVRIVRRIHEHVPDGCPLIVAGDFNDWRESAAGVLEAELGVQEVFQTLHGKHARSFPSWFPFLPLDRIYVRDFRPLTARCFTESPWDRLSDHGALATELAF